MKVKTKLPDYLGSYSSNDNYIGKEFVLHERNYLDMGVIYDNKLAEQGMWLTVSQLKALLLSLESKLMPGDRLIVESYKDRGRKLSTLTVFGVWR